MSKPKIKIVIAGEAEQRTFRDEATGLEVVYKVRAMEQDEVLEIMERLGVQDLEAVRDLNPKHPLHARIALACAKACVTEIESITQDGEPVPVTSSGKPINPRDPQFKDKILSAQPDVAIHAYDEAGALQLELAGERQNLKAVPD